MQSYEIVSVGSGKAIGVEGASLQKGVRVLQETFQESLSQQWFLIDVGVVNGKSVYILICAKSAMVLDVNEASTADGALVHQWNYFGGANQKWFLEGAGYFNNAKTVQLVSVNSGKALTVIDESDKDGAPLVQSTYQGAASQQWLLEPLSARNKGSYLLSKQYLSQDEYLLSQNEKYCAYMQGDGNFVLCYATATTPPGADLERPYWSCFANPQNGVGQKKKDPPYIATLQYDANFVLYNGYAPDNTSGAYWASKTARSQNGYFIAALQDDGTFALCNGGDPTALGTPYWSTPTAWVSKRVTGVNSLSTGQELGVDGYLVSPNGQYVVTLQSDGNFVVYQGNDPTDKSKPIWASGSNRNQGQYMATMQDDGNFVLYNGPNSNAKGAAIWATRVWGNGQYKATMQDNGTFAIFSINQADVPLWTTYVKAHPGAFLYSGQYLGVGDTLVSQNGKYRAAMQPDGNFVIFEAIEPGQPAETMWVAKAGSLWCRQEPGNYFALLRYDGSLALANGIDDNATVHISSTNTSKRGHYIAKLEDDGTLTIYAGTDPNTPQSLVLVTKNLLTMPVGAH